jgi:cytochrome c-type biogenesis protein CcmH
MEEAAKLSPEERAERIQAMVEGLAAKLEENPQNFQGWIQLIRAYTVRKQPDKAKEALSKARKVFEKAPFPTQQLAELANELGLEGDAPRGPTQEDVQAAQEMSPEDRQEMIKGMVAQLAERLKENPNDLPGWTRLARSYAVLQQNDKAKEALAQALKIAPGNVDLLILFGRTARSMNGDRSTPESLDAMRKVLTLKPTHVEALWFLGGAAADAGKKDEAKSLWERAIAQFPAGAPERSQLRARIDQLK